MKKYILVLLVIVFSSKHSFAQTISIAAAANLRGVLDEVSDLFKKENPKAEVKITYGSSGNLTTQLMNNAPFDMFLSADMDYPNKLKEKGLTSSEPAVYTIGKLVLWSSKLDVSKGFKVFDKNDIGKIAVGNSKLAPYGKAAEEALKYYKLYDKVSSKFVVGENISQVAQFAVTGNAELAFIALSQALSKEMKDKGKYYVIDEKSYQAIKQGFVVLKSSKEQATCTAFSKFLLSRKAQQIFTKYGYKTAI